MSRDISRDLSAQIEEINDAPPPVGGGQRLRRFRVKVRPTTVLSLFVLGGAVYVLLPQIGSVPGLIATVGRADWWWLIAAAAAGALTFPAAAAGYMAAVEHPLPPLRTALVQLASSFTGRLTPAGLGGLGLNVIYMERIGVLRRRALGAVAINHAAGAIVHAVGVFAVIWFIGSSGIGGVDVPSGWLLLVGAVAAFVAAGLFLATPFGRRRVLVPGIDAIRNLLRMLRDPLRTTGLFGASALVTLANGLALVTCLLAVGAEFSFWAVLAVYVGGSAIAAPSPTPGALGAVEAALVAGLTGIGIEATTAVAAVLIFRFITFWLPILPGFAAYGYLQHRRFV